MLKQRLLYVLFLLCFISTTSYSQVIVTYDKDTQTFCVDIDECDPCILGAENSQICNCRRDCGVAEGIREECEEHCSHLVGNPYDHCLSKCLQRSIRECRDECGLFSATKWPYIDHITMGLSIIVADIPFHPLTHEDAVVLESDGIAIDEQGYELNNFYKFDDNCLDVEEHDISGFNLCFTYDIRILIGESGTAERRECVFRGEYCIIKG